MRGNQAAATEARTLVGAVSGVKRTDARIATGSLVVHYDPALVSPEKIVSILVEKGVVPLFAPKISAPNPYLEEALRCLGTFLIKRSVERVFLRLV